MAKFSVEWLSQSFYAPHMDAVGSVDGSIHGETEFTREPRSQDPPTSPNNSCGYTSSSESEVGEDGEGESAQQRRMRTKFTSAQISKLESTFIKHRYLGATQRRKIAEKLHLSETQVKTWFQNRRMKLKREAQDARHDFLPVPAALLPPLVFQHPALNGQLQLQHQQSALYRHLHPLQPRPTPPNFLPRHFY